MNATLIMADVNRYALTLLLHLSVAAFKDMSLIKMKDPAMVCSIANK